MKIARAAARLQQLAQPGTVVVSEATHRLVVDYFETQDLGEHSVKGYAEPVPAFEVLRTHGRCTRLEVVAERGARCLKPPWYTWSNLGMVEGV